jgi:type IV pilus assembly protein PilY1
MNAPTPHLSWIQRWRLGLSRRAGFATVTAALLLTGLGLSWLVHSQSTAPSYPAITLSSTPLYATTPIDKPSLALALSVEYPTVGAQYTPGGSSDNTYANTTEYLGYYDAESCYTYNDSPSETPANGLTASDYKRFDRSGAAASRKCTNAFSGNFLNWASNSAIDMLRLALSGGDRYIDQDGLTILQRALIPNGDPICMWNSSNFPAKQLSKDGGGAGTYWGAVPTAMITAANGSDIYVANTLNKIYFGTSATGNCSTGPANYVLNSPAANQAVGPVVTNTNISQPNGMTNCASENGTCSFTGTKEVWYGAGNRWAVAPAYNGVGCNNNVFGDPYSGTVKACYYRNYTGTWTPPTAAGTQLNSDGFFYSRVQVCNKASGALADVRDYGLCSLYPSGNYKPTGVIQKYSDQLRLAAFGYLMDPTASYNNGRYGGVLRAPMKYVGYKTFDETGNDNTPSTGNANVEWNTTTGIFVTNPDSDTMGISGVVNYLNKFGRTGSVAGRYKTYDPVGELHYEVLRYLQGLSPSADAISNITTDMKDGYPVFTTWTDPYGGSRTSTADYSCVRSNIVVIGDINTHDGNRLPSTDMANNIIDISGWRTTVQNFEKNVSSTYADGWTPSQNRTTGNPNGANNSVPSNTTTSQIMGSAYWAHTHDIRGTTWTNATAKQRPGLRVKTFLFDVNEYGSQNDTNTRRYANQFFMASKYGGFETDASNVGSNPYNTWGNPFKQQDGTNNNNVWQNLTSPGEASTYYLQSSARGVLSAFNGIFSRAANSSRNIAGVALQSKYLTATNGSVIYQGAFDTSNWTGDVLALPLTVSGSTVTLGTTPNWSAADVLTNRANPSTSRTIVMGVAGATANPVATDFQWASVSAAVQTALNKASPTAAADALGSSRLSYLRGDRSLEGTTFRTRSKLLGDVINSSVVYAGKPAAGYTENAYSTFYSTNASRTAAVYVGANDGMLHAFNASTGAELFGYIPSWMSTKLSALTSTSYANNHQSYVDGLPAVGEACVGASHTLSATTCTWKSVLVSGTGAGGQGVFALDVTDPTAFSTSKVMWEFTNTDDADLGYVVGQPQILKLVTSAPGAASTT